MTISALSSATGSTTASANDTNTAAATSDRFLKLLVAQMQNQDPLNPMDNAQVTTQMAQINTVSGIEKLNGTVAGLSTQFVQMQALQGATLVGRDVIVPGNKLDVVNNVAQGGFEMDGAADAVKVEVLNAGGHVVDTLQLGAQDAGRHSFDWDPSKSGSDAATMSFRITATSGANPVTTTALMRDTVTAVSTSGGSMTLELERSGSVAYDKVKAFN